MDSKVKRYGFDGGGNFVQSEHAEWVHFSDYDSLRKELEEAKAKIAELEKEVQIKQTAIDALLDPEF